MPTYPAPSYTAPLYTAPGQTSSGNRSSATTSGPAAGNAVAATRQELRDMVLRAQIALNARGYDAGPADGILGERTRSAIRTFQGDSRLPVTGRLDGDTLVKLGITGM